MRIELIVADREKAENEISKIVQQLNGNIAQTIAGQSGDSSISMDLRIPSENSQKAIELLSTQIGELKSIYIWGQDITDQYADLHARLKELQTAIDQQSGDNYVEIEHQIEDIRSKLAYRLERAAYDTIIVHFND